MTLYDDDILLWSERQADLLRRTAAGERVNSAELDWPNIAEEIEDVGSNRLHAVESLLVQALRHTLKADAWPVSLDAPSWRADAIDFRRQEVRAFFTENVLMWLMDYRFDGLRFDAVHAIEDQSWVDEMAAIVRATVEPGRHVHLVLEHHNDA